MAQPTSISWWKITLWAVVVAIALGFLYLVRGILLPFVLAFIIAVLLEPTIKRLRTRGISRGVAVLTVFVGFFGVLTAGIIYATPIVTNQLSGFTDSVGGLSRQLAVQDFEQNPYVRWNPKVVARPPGAANQIDVLLEKYRAPIEKLGFPANRRALVERYVDPHRDRLTKGIQQFFTGFLGIIGTAASQFLMLLFTPIFVALMLTDMERMAVKTASWIPPSIRRETVHLLRDVGHIFLRYLRGVTIMVGIYTVMMAIVLLMLGAPYSVLLALLFGALYMIPYLGSFISCLSLFMATGLSGMTGNWFLDLGNPWAFAAIVTTIFFVISEVYDKLVTPQLMGRAIGLNPLVSMFVVFSGGALFGLVGMILAFPIAGSVKVILERILKVTSTQTVDQLSLPVVPLRHRAASEV